MKIHLAIATCTPRLLDEAVGHAEATLSTTADVDLLVLFNGCEISPYAGKMKRHVTWQSENVGVVPALHTLYAMATALDHEAGEADSIVAYIHDDFHILEEGWDRRLSDLFLNPNIALAGCGGAMRLGTRDLYKKPYEMRQLARGDFRSNMENAHDHGSRHSAPCRVATLDGMSLFARRSFLDTIGGWSWWPHIHHSYDNAICCEVARAGRETWLLPLACRHVSGQTANMPGYQSGIAQKFGGDVAIHRDGHVTLYERYRDVLPIVVG